MKQAGRVRRASSLPPVMKYIVSHTSSSRRSSPSSHCVHLLPSSYHEDRPTQGSRQRINISPLASSSLSLTPHPPVHSLLPAAVASLLLLLFLIGMASIFIFILCPHGTDVSESLPSLPSISSSSLPSVISPADEWSPSQFS
jgi:hypothetical protein